ncbi:MAG TPA: glycosyltransferase family 4 protein [Candidatus Dormibacteraeota bacterium]|nr:glycosyltransferase family 4 protein [Candidatus Dormibacteraeota bacterium]
MPVPPREYGGTERIVHALTQELVARGHDVTLFAAAGSETSAELHSSSPAPLWESGADALAAHAIEIEDMVGRSAEFDVIHSHLDVLPWLAGDRYQAPLVTTMHGRLDLPDQRKVLARFRERPLVSISDAQRKPVDDLHLNWRATVHHGLDLERIYHLGKGDKGYLAFVSRLTPEKAPHLAIDVAIKAEMRIVVAGKVPDEDRDYYESKVKPRMDNPLVEWAGELDDGGKDEVIGGAVGFIVPIQWDEPFGLAFIEALATGTPVISMARGSLPELMESGRHGFLCSSEDELIAACHKLGEIDRAECRRWVLERFSPSRMAAGYEAVYSGLIAGRRAAS